MLLEVLRHFPLVTFSYNYNYKNDSSPIIIIIFLLGIVCVRFWLGLLGYVRLSSWAKKHNAWHLHRAGLGDD